MTQTTRTACSYCGVGCGISVETRTDPQSGLPVIARVSGDRLHPSNFGRLCTKGATHAEMMAATDGRLSTALVRPARGEATAPVDVETAVAEAGRRLREIRDEHGPDAIALYVSGQMSIEAQYLANKLAKGFIRTVHIESNSRLCMASAGTGYKQSLGADGPPGSYADFDTSDLFFVTGSNMADCHPILFLRMADRLKAGAKLIVVDPRRTTTAERADLYLPIRPGTDLALLNGLLHLLVERGDIDQDFIVEHTEGWQAMPEFLADYPPSVVADITGLDEDDIRTAATMIADAGEWMTCWTMGLNQSTHGTWNTNAICNLHLATGAICRTGSGPMSLTGQPNAMGGREMGYMGPGLPGQRAVTSAQDRAFVEEQWGLAPDTIRTDVGPGTIEMFDMMRGGDIKACWIICTNPVATVANRSTVIEGLEAADLVITQDAYADTATNRYADIVLPAALWAEADAVMVNSERNLTLLAQSLPAPGQARPDWELICGVAEHMGFGADFAYKSSEDIFDEIRRLSNPRTGYDLRGASYDRLRETPLQWPVAPGGSASGRNPIRYLNDGVSQDLFTDESGRTPRLAFPTPSRRAVFHPRPHMEARELPDDDYPMVLNTGRLQHQWHTMTKTGRVDKLNRLDNGPFVEIHPDDAARFGIADGARVEVTSRRGRAVLPAVVTDRVLTGTCFAPFHWNDEHGTDLTINALTNDAVDPVSLQPEFKACAVRLVPVPIEATSARLWVAAAPAGDGELAQDGPLVLWASQTGNAEEFATTVAGRLHGSRLLAMNDASLGDLADRRDVVIVTSTFGDGGPPDNGADFWDRLEAPDAPTLAGVRYAVFGLGDRSYDNFCGHAKSLDRRLTDLGASSVVERTECEVYDDEPMALWADRVVQVLGTTDVAGAAPSAAVGSTRAAGPQPFTRAAPLRVPLSRNVLLTSPRSAKEVRQFGFDISEHDVTYSVGDALGVHVTNAPAVVDAWLAAAGLSGSEPVHLDGTDVALRDALTSSYDLCRVTPNLLTFVAERCRDRKAARMLARSSASRDAWLHNRNGIDVLEEFAVRADPVEWQDVLVRLTPRSYSIASSPLVSPHEVQLTVSVVRYRNPRGVQRGGAASTLLADRATHAEVFLQPSPHFRPPEDGATPMIMVGPGTGVAPFRGFLQERRALGHRGPNWLFFGEQHRAENYYYRDDLEDMVRDGLLNRLDLAFSRDQARRVYVQHKMSDYGADVWRWLEDGAHLYVCGDASRMAKDVDDTLTAIIRTHGRLSDTAARDYKRELVATKRYVRDVY
ncbi:bifunctional nitrate reductase/sulfite reductase flavoprotein subunit alpha [Mycolicibacterium sp. YH-1]|uniref:bifunctional nitrate reductase/sulfite reductase flavoprotein subunit alpha n=1 Tax=Mycolicibacterium sp. YH-1 TaxID=2908837 RepID=UPI001F4BEF03|nr:bifunctional nitrate reductase/sulfite reductase flavoprotein subunit alpha [Mycolicibacterium sp. YH-1]UNB55223.1 bifunctional nitrate reductase/sulfite reductase flavoprotein subunit alpha [Mycolicibacterium sp. YH-1]